MKIGILDFESHDMAKEKEAEVLDNIRKIGGIVAYKRPNENVYTIARTDV